MFKSLLQQCAFVRIDGISYGSPINLISEDDDDWMVVKQASNNFKGIDLTCYTLVISAYEELEKKLSNSQSIKGNNNVQINAKGSVTSSTGSNSIAAGGNVTINQGISPEVHAEKLTEERVKYEMLKKELETFKNSKDEEIQIRAAEKAEELAQELIANNEIKIDPWSSIDLGKVAMLRGSLHTSESYYRKSLNLFKNIDAVGEASAFNGLGLIADTRGDLREAERLYKESLSIRENLVTDKVRQTY